MPKIVAPREGRVSRNQSYAEISKSGTVAPREGRVSRNILPISQIRTQLRRAPRGACE